MTSQPPSYRGYRFPADIISHAVWLYHRFGLSFRDVEDLLAERGVTVTYEAIRQWCLTFGLDYARRLRRRLGHQGHTWYLDEVSVKILGRQQYLWRAVDEDGDVIDRRIGQRVGDDRPRAVDTKMELLPAALAAFAVFRSGPFTLTHDRESRTVDDQMDGAVGREAGAPDLEALTPPRDGGVVGGLEIDTHQRQY